MRNPTELARKCFALAKSPGTAAEGEAALARGMAIIERHGLNPDHFDIPGRKRQTSGNRASTVILDDIMVSHSEGPYAEFFAATQAAEIRKAADLTQTDVAEAMGISQSDISRLERRGDMMLSTLASYLLRVGERPRVVVTVNGEDVELDLVGRPLQKS